MSRRLLRVTKWNLARICVLRDPRWHHFGLRVHGQRSQARAGWHLGQPPRVRTTRARYVVDAGSAGAPPQAGALRPSGLRAFHARSAIVQLRDAAHRLRNGDGRRGPAACGTARRLLRRAASHRVRCAAPASRHGPRSWSTASPVRTSVPRPHRRISWRKPTCCWPPRARAGRKRSRPSGRSSSRS